MNTKKLSVLLVIVVVCLIVPFGLKGIGADRDTEETDRYKAVSG